MELDWLTHMKHRFTYICSILPAIFLLNNIPRCLQGIWQLVVACILAIVVWALVWLRLYSLKKLRPEFSALIVLPQLIAYTCLWCGLSIPQETASPIWQNLYTLLWIGVAYVGICSMRPGSWEKPQDKRDSVYIMMWILTVVYSFYCCGEFFLIIFPQ